MSGSNRNYFNPAFSLVPGSNPSPSSSLPRFPRGTLPPHIRPSSPTRGSGSLSPENHSPRATRPALGLTKEQEKQFLEREIRATLASAPLSPLNPKIFAHLHGDAFIKNTDFEGGLMYENATILTPLIEALVNHQIIASEIGEFAHQDLSHIIGYDTAMNQNYGDRQMAFRQAQAIASSIESLPAGKTLTIPGGWKSATDPHAMLYKITRNYNGTYRFIVFNSGLGLHLHEKARSALKTKSAPVLLYDHIPLWKLHREFLFALITQQMAPTDESGRKCEKVYATIDLQLKDFNVPCHVMQEFITGQRSGVCSMKVIFAALRHYILEASLPLKEYKKAVFFIKYFSLLHFFSQIRGNLAESNTTMTKNRKLLKEAAEKLLTTGSKGLSKGYLDPSLSEKSLIAINALLEEVNKAEKEAVNKRKIKKPLTISINSLPMSYLTLPNPQPIAQIRNVASQASALEWERAPQNIHDVSTLIQKQIDSAKDKKSEEAKAQINLFVKNIPLPGSSRFWNTNRFNSDELHRLIKSLYELQNLYATFFQATESFALPHEKNTLFSLFIYIHHLSTKIDDDKYGFCNFYQFRESLYNDAANPQGVFLSQADYARRNEIFTYFRNLPTPINQKTFDTQISSYFSTTNTLIKAESPTYYNFMETHKNDLKTHFSVVTNRTLPWNLNTASEDEWICMELITAPIENSIFKNLRSELEYVLYLQRSAILVQSLFKHQLKLNVVNKECVIAYTNNEDTSMGAKKHKYYLRGDASHLPRNTPYGINSIDERLLDQYSNFPSHSLSPKFPFISGHPNYNDTGNGTLFKESYINLAVNTENEHQNHAPFIFAEKFPTVNDIQNIEEVEKALALASSIEPNLRLSDLIALYRKFPSLAEKKAHQNFFLEQFFKITLKNDDKKKLEMSPPVNKEVWNTSYFKDSVLAFLEEGKRTYKIEKQSDTPTTPSEKLSPLLFYMSVARILYSYSKEFHDTSFSTTLENYRDDLNDYLQNSDEYNFSRSDLSLLHQERLLFYSGLPIGQHLTEKQNFEIIESFLHTTIHSIDDPFKERHKERIIKNFVSQFVSTNDLRVSISIKSKLSGLLTKLGIPCNVSNWIHSSIHPHILRGDGWEVNIFNGEIQENGDLISFPIDETEIYKNESFKELFGNTYFSFTRKNGYICFTKGNLNFRFPYNDSSLEHLELEFNGHWIRFCCKNEVLVSSERLGLLSPIFSGLIADHHFFDLANNRYLITDNQLKPKYIIDGNKILTSNDGFPIQKPHFSTWNFFKRFESEKFIFIETTSEGKILTLPRYSSNGNPLRFIENRQTGEFELETDREFCLQSQMDEGLLEQFPNYLVLEKKNDPNTRVCLIPDLEYDKTNTTLKKSEFDLIGGASLDVLDNNKQNEENFSLLRFLREPQALSKSYFTLPFVNEKLVAKTPEEHLFLAYLYFGQKNYIETVKHLKAVDTFDLHSSKSLKLLKKIFELPASLPDNSIDACSIRARVAFLKMQLSESDAEKQDKYPLDPFQIVQVMEEYIGSSFRIKNDLKLTTEEEITFIDTLLDQIESAFKATEALAGQISESLENPLNKRKGAEEELYQIKSLIQNYKGGALRQILLDRKELLLQKKPLLVTEWFSESTESVPLTAKLPSQYRLFPGTGEKSYTYQELQEVFQWDLLPTFYSSTPITEDVFWRLCQIVVTKTNVSKEQLDHLGFVFHTFLRFADTTAHTETKNLVSILAAFLSSSNSFESYTTWFNNGKGRIFYNTQQTQNPNVALTHTDYQQEWYKQALATFNIDITNPVPLTLQTFTYSKKVDSQNVTLHPNDQDEAPEQIASPSLSLRLDESSYEGYFELSAVTNTLASLFRQNIDDGDNASHDISQAMPNNRNFLEAYQKAFHTFFSKEIPTYNPISFTSLQTKLKEAISKIKEEFIKTQAELINEANCLSDNEIIKLLQQHRLSGKIKNKITFPDLIYLFVHGKAHLYGQKNQNLTEFRAQELYEKTAKCLYLGIQLKKLEELNEKTDEVLKANPQDRNSTLEVLTKFAETEKLGTDIAIYREDPKLLAFEYNSGLIFRKNPDQVAAIKHMSRKNQHGKYLDSVFQMAMGGGKTSVLLANLLAASDGIPILVTPSFQYQTIYEQLKHTLKRCFNIRLLKCNYSKEQLTLPNLRYVKKMLLRILNGPKTGEKKALVLCPEMIQTLKLEFLSNQHELLNGDMSKAKHEKISLLAEILDLLKKQGNAIGDEVQTLFDTNKETTFSIGEPKRIEPSYLNLLKEIFLTLSQANVTIPEKGEVSIDSLLQLRENKQAYLDPQVYVDHIVPTIAKLLAENYAPLHLTGVDEATRAGFIRYISGQMDAKVQLAALNDPQALLDVEANEVMKKDLRFVKYLERNTQSRNARDRLSSNLIALTKHLLTDVLSATFTKTGNLNYGRTANPNAPGQIKPYIAAGTESTTEFGYHYEAAAYHFATVLNRGVSEEQIISLATDFHKNADWFEHSRDMKYEETAPFRDCIRLFKCSPREAIKNAKAIADNLTISDRLKIEALTIEKYVRYYPLRATSTAHDLKNSLKSFRATGGTLCKDSLPLSMRSETKEDDTVNPAIIHKVLQKTGPDSVKIIPKEIKEDKELLKQLITNHSEPDRISAIIDAGGVFKDFDPVKLGPALIDVLNELENKHPERPQKKAVLFFTKAHGSTTADYFALINRDKEIFILPDTKEETLEKYGFTKNDTLSIYDQRHCLGTDIKQPENGIGVMTFAKKVSQDLSCQAIMRLRGFFENQSLAIMIPETDARKMNSINRQFPSLYDESLVDPQNIRTQRSLLLGVLSEMNTAQLLEEMQDVFRSHQKALFDVVFQAAVAELLSVWTEKDDTITPQNRYERACGLLKGFFSSLFVSTEDRPFDLFGNLCRNIPAIDSLTNYATTIMEKFERELTKNKNFLVHNDGDSEIGFAIDGKIEGILAKVENEIKAILVAASEVENHMIEKTPEVVGKAANGATSENGVQLQVAALAEVKVEQELTQELQEEMALYQVDGSLEETNYSLNAVAAKRHLNDLLNNINNPRFCAPLPETLQNDKIYKQPYYTLFDDNLFISSNCYNPYNQPVSLFERRPPFEHLLYIRKKNGQKIALLISSLEASVFKSLSYDRMDCALLRADGSFEAGNPEFINQIDPNDVELKKLLVQVNILNPNAGYLIKHLKEYVTWFDQDPTIVMKERKKCFLKLRAEFAPSHKPFVYQYLTQIDLLKRILQEEEHMVGDKLLLEEDSRICEADVPHLEDPDKIRNVPFHWVNQLTPKQIPHIKIEQVRYITSVECIRVVSKELLQNLSIDDFEENEDQAKYFIENLETSQIAHITSPTLIPFITNQSISSLKPDLIPHLGVANIADRVVLMSDPQRNHLSQEQISKAAQDLSGYHVPNLPINFMIDVLKRKDLLAHLTKDQVESIHDKELLKELSPQAMVHLKPTQLRILPNEQYKKFDITHKHLLKDIPPNGFQNLPANMQEEALNENNDLANELIPSNIPNLSTRALKLIPPRNNNLLANISQAQIAQIGTDTTLLQRLPITQVDLAWLSKDQRNKLSDDQYKRIDSNEFARDLDPENAVKLKDTLFLSLLKQDPQKYAPHVKPEHVPTLSKESLYYLVDKPDLLAHLDVNQIQNIQPNNQRDKDLLCKLPKKCFEHMMPHQLDNLSDEQYKAIRVGDKPENIVVHLSAVHLHLLQNDVLCKGLRNYSKPNNDIISRLRPESIPKLEIDLIQKLKNENLIHLSKEQVGIINPKNLPNLFRNLPPVTFKHMNEEQLNSLSNEQYLQFTHDMIPLLKHLTSENLTKIPLTIIPEVTDQEVLKKLTPKMVCHVKKDLIPDLLDKLPNNVLSSGCIEFPILTTHLKAASVPKLEVKAIPALANNNRPLLENLTPAQVKDFGLMDINTLKKFPDTKLALMNDEQLKNLSPDQQKKLSPDKLVKLDETVLKDLTPGILHNIKDQEIVNKLPPKLLSNEQIPLLEKEQLAKLNGDQVKAFGHTDKATLQRFPSSLFKYMTKEQLKALSPAQIREIKEPAILSQLTPYQIADICPDVVNLLEKDELKHLKSKELIAKLKFTKILSLNPNQLAYASFMRKVAYAITTLALAIFSTITLFPTEFFYWPTRLCRLLFLKGAHEATLNNLIRFAKLTAHLFMCCPKAK